LAFTASDYIVDAANLYGDSGYDRLTEELWIKYLNASIRALVLVRPDAGAQTDNMQLVAGVLQRLPDTALRMLDITRNMGIDGLTPGKIITPVKRQHIDYSNLLWPAATGDTEIDNFSYDKENPRIFYVTPPVDDTIPVYVEIQVSQLPTPVVVPTDTLGINDIFFEPLVQYMLYKAFVADDESVEFQKAITYMQTFFSLLQVETAVSVAAGPEGKE
jgi:hypothetical protein